MGWMIKRLGANRDSLKRSVREALESRRGIAGNAHPARIATAVDSMIDAFPGLNGLTLEVVTQGHVELDGSGAASITITTISSEEML